MPRDLFAALLKQVDELRLRPESLVTLLDVLSDRRLPEAALLHGNVVHGEAMCGAVAGLVYQVVGAGEAVHCMVVDCNRIVARL